MAQLPLGAPAPANGHVPHRTSPDTPMAAYVHVPFCTVRCGYCDFNTYTSAELRGVTRQSFIDDLCSEIQFSAGVMTDSQIPVRALSSIFFGGGTPTLLEPAAFARILDDLRSVHGIDTGAEITIEANPDTVTPTILQDLASAGVTRVSFGMQSAVPRVLALLDRSHDATRMPEVVDAARAAGLSTSVDLIYGTPTETIDEWMSSVDAALALGTDHISAYSLIVEEGTAMARRISRGELPDVDDDTHAEMYDRADEAFAAAGLEWYEVSNWSVPGKESRHNQAYWRSDDWWGYGPGAHSHIGGVRWWNAKHPAAYAERLAGGESPALGREILDDDQRHFERILLQSRVRAGIDLAELDESGRHEVAGLIADGLVEGAAAIAGRLVMTRRGRLLADAVVRRITD